MTALATTTPADALGNLIAAKLEAALGPLIAAMQARSASSACDSDDHCPAGGACNGTCKACRPKAQVPAFSCGIPGLFMPGCYSCKEPDPCLLPYLETARKDMDAWSWMHAMMNEGELVHLDKNAGAAPFKPTTPLAANEVLLWTQNIEQILPYIPGLLKVSAQFSDGKDHHALVQLELFVGSPHLTGLTNTDGLIKVGQAFKFEDFVCGNSCYLVAWPSLLGCDNNVIPNKRAIYVKVTAGALPDGVTLTSLSIVIIKGKTKLYANCCSKYNLG